MERGKHRLAVPRASTRSFEVGTSRFASNLQRQRELADCGEKYAIADSELAIILERVTELLERVAATPSTDPGGAI